ncbi:MAG: TonB-dependent receptor [Candidatus Binatia bacterium]
MGELLRNSTGVQVSRSGGREDLSTVSIRGSTAAQVRVLLDGVALSLASSDVVNLADIPIDAVERIEIYRGFSPLGLSSSGASSTINIITKRITGESLNASLSYGSFGSFKASAAGSTTAGGGTVAAFVTYKTTDGDFEFEFDDTPANPDDPLQRRKRRNNDHESIDVLLRYLLPLADGAELMLSNDIYHKNEGAPGSESKESTVSRLRSTRDILAAAYRGSSGVRASADLTILDETLRDPTTDADIDTNLGLPFEVADNQTVAATLRLGRGWEWRRWHLFDVAIESAYERFEGRFPAIANGPSRDQQRYRLGVAFGDEVYFPRLKLTLSPQLRGDLVHNLFDVDNLPIPINRADVPDETVVSIDPRLGLRWQAWPRVTIQGNAGTYFRPPSFDELFGSDGFSAANPALDPEQGVNLDAGFRVELNTCGILEDGTFEYAYFVNRVDDQIVFLPSGARVPRPQNIGKTAARGHELRLELQGPHDLALTANYTAQNTKNKSRIIDFSGEKIPTLPDQEAFVRLSVGAPRWRLAYELAYRGEVFLDQSNDRAVNAYTTHGLILTLRPALVSALAIKLEATNLGDQRSQDRLGFPVPGRAFFLTLSYARPADDGVEQ